MARRPIAGATVVIVGASSGLGRATAHAFACRGANLVLAARGQRALQQVVEECRQLGTRAFAAPADVCEPRDMLALAKYALDLFGRIDVWINNAGVGAIGDFLDTPLPAHEQVVRTNLLGALHGAYAVLPVFERQGEGVMINTNSVGAWSPTPFSAAYGASKAGLRGLTRALQAEYSRWPGIHIAAIYPTFLDTPGLLRGGNYAGREVKPPPGLWDAERIAAYMVDLAERPRPGVMPGLLSKLSRIADLALPNLSGTVAARGFEAYLRRAEEVPESDGVLFGADERSSGVHGPWHERGRPGVAAGLAALGAVAGVALMMRAAARR